MTTPSDRGAADPAAPAPAPQPADPAPAPVPATPTPAAGPAPAAPATPSSATPATPGWRRWLDHPQHRKTAAAVGAATAIALLIVIRLASGSVGVIGPTTGGPGGDPGRTGVPGDLDLELLKRATVLISTHPTDPGRAGWGSGSIISGDGLILTNAHVAANRAPGLGVLFGGPITEDVMGPASPRTHYIYTVQGDEAAAPTYRADTLVADGYLDLAILRITALADGTPVDASDLDLRPVPLGSIDDIRAGEELTVLGYPGIADSLRVHVTRGAFSNLKDDPLVGPGAWMNTDAKIAQGNSGGLAADEAGRLVGIPDRVRPDDRDTATAEYVMRPIDLARPLLAAVEAGTPWDPYTYVTPASGNERIDVRGWTATEADTCEDAPPTTIPAGSKRMVAHVDFRSMVPGDHLLIGLLRNTGGEITIEDSFPYDWPKDAASDQCLTVQFGSQTPYPAGDYQMAVLIGPNYETELELGGPGPLASIGGQEAPGPSPTFSAVGECDEAPVEEWDGTPGDRIAGLPTPTIPYPSGEQAGGTTTIMFELSSGSTDRRSAEQLALAERARSAGIGTTHSRWIVVAVDGGYRAFTGEVWQPFIAGRNNPILPCDVTEARAKVVSSYAAYHDFFGTGAYYHSAWTAEGGHTITDGNTGRVIVTGPGGTSGPAPDVPFLPGPEATKWLLDNVTGRNLGVSCQSATPSVAAWGNGAIAQVVCGPSGAYDVLAYTLYESERAMTSYWDGRVDATRSMLASDVCAAGTWHYADNATDPKGGLLCERITTTEGRPAAQIEWTEEDWRIAAFVRKVDGDIAALWGTWTQAGSLPRAP